MMKISFDYDHIKRFAFHYTIEMKFFG